jgi:hypothetical protein
MNDKPCYLFGKTIQCALNHSLQEKMQLLQQRMDILARIDAVDDPEEGVVEVEVIFDPATNLLQGTQL